MNIEQLNYEPSEDDITVMLCDRWLRDDNDRIYESGFTHILTQVHNY